MINHLWQSTVFGAAVWVLTLSLRRNAASVRYWLWFAASMKFLVPFSLFVALGSHLSVQAETALAPVRVAAIVEQVVEPASALAPVVVSRPSAVDWSAVWIGIWACGVVVMGIRWAREWMRMRAYLKNGQRLSLGVPVKTMATGELLEPGVFGFLRPVLLLPEGILERLSPAEFRGVIAHELCHVRRRDNLFAAIHMTIEALFWFHPLIWWIGSRMVAEREWACDEEVLRMGSDPEAYAEGILKVCELYVAPRLECVAGVTGADLRRRIEAIMKCCITTELTVIGKAGLAAAAVAAIALPVTVGVMHGQTAAAPLAFEVASIRPHIMVTIAGENGSRMAVLPGLSLSGNRVSLTQTVSGLVAEAYNVRENQISGGPDWIYRGSGALGTNFYDIAAKSPGERPPTRDEVRQMFQTLLADRFRLRFHRETKELPAYALVVDKTGPKLRASTSEESGAGGGMAGGRLKVTGTRVSAAELASRLSPHLDRPVVDRTGLSCCYDFTLEFERENSAPESSGTSIFTAVREQLGLRLEAIKQATEVLVVEQVERPSEN